MLVFRVLTVRRLVQGNEQDLLHQWEAEHFFRCCLCSLWVEVFAVMNAKAILIYCTQHRDYPATNDSPSVGLVVFHVRVEDKVCIDRVSKTFQMF